jgi:hypothetical protein
MKPMTLLKMLSRVVPGEAARRHFADCAVYEIVDRRLRSGLPPLTHRQVLAIQPAPRAPLREVDWGAPKGTEAW